MPWEWEEVDSQSGLRLDFGFISFVSFNISHLFWNMNEAAVHKWWPDHTEPQVNHWFVLQPWECNLWKDYQMIRTNAFLTRRVITTALFVMDIFSPGQFHSLSLLVDLRRLGLA